MTSQISLARTFESVRVLIVGDVMLDRYWHGETSRISPEAPVPVVRLDATDDVRPGGAANVAINVASLGGQPLLCGVIGDDEAGAQLDELLREAGVEPHLVMEPGLRTLTKLRVLSRHQQLIRLDFEDTLPSRAPAALAARAEALIDSVDAVILSDYAKGTLVEPGRLIAAARRAGRPVLVDPKGADFTRYRGASVVTPNLLEFEAAAGVCADAEVLAERAADLRRTLELEALLVTRGEHGMTLAEAGRDSLHVPAKAREVFDVTGAGDTVIAVFGAAMAAGVDLRTAMALANAAAGVVVSKLGTASASVPEIESALTERSAHPRGAVGLEALLAALDAERAKGRHVVMTNGCFDLLHAGHVRYLEQARALGDVLIVAVNDDDSVRRLKGDGRPLIAVAERMAVLAGLESVDWVVAFSEDTPESLVRRLCPDVLVKGGDYRGQEIAGGAFTRARGGKVAYLDYVEGPSTSAIIGAAAHSVSGPAIAGLSQPDAAPERVADSAGAASGGGIGRGESGSMSEVEEGRDA